MATVVHCDICDNHPALNSRRIWTQGLTGKMDSQTQKFREVVCDTNTIKRESQRGAPDLCDQCFEEFLIRTLVGDPSKVSKILNIIRSTDELPD